MKPERRKKIRLGELLIEQKVINEAQLQQALSEQKKTGRKLGRVLTDLGIVQEQQLNDALARHLQIPFVDLKQLTLDQATVRLLPEALARRFRALVLKSDARGLTIGMADPTDLFVYDERGNLVSLDDSPAADAVCAVTPAWTGPFRLKVKAHRGLSGYRIQVQG